MEKRIYTNGFAGAVVALTLSLPTPLVAGSYGSAGVSDAPVGRYAGQATVWCERLDASVPESLFREMECGASDDGIARSAVAGERVTNRSRGFLGGLLGPHVRGTNIPTDDDEPERTVRSTPTPTEDDNGDPTPIASNDPPTPTTPTTPNSPVGKWDRLGELGVTEQNFNDQSDSFRQEVGDFLSGSESDWSNFNPDGS